MDVTDTQAILAAFSKAKEVFGRVDVVINNAGWTAASEVESTPDDISRKVFETNFWGATNVAKEAVRFFRDENPSGAGGRLITISSFVAIKPVVIGGYYSASKHGKLHQICYFIFLNLLGVQPLRPFYRPWQTKWTRNGT